MRLARIAARPLMASTRFVADSVEVSSHVKSSLEIAQQHELLPIEDVAAVLGLLPDEIESYGRYKAKISLSVLDRVRPSPDAKLVCVAGMTPTRGGEGNTTTVVSLTDGLAAARQAARCLSARALARSGVWDQGRRGRRWPVPSRAYGGAEPSFHR